MPNRILKESICTSESVDKLSWFEEVLFYRLIVNCDDYGRFDGRTAIIKSRLFPLKNVTDKQINDALNKLSTVGIVDMYMCDRKPYLQFVTWDRHQRVRNKNGKYPSIDKRDDYEQFQTIANNLLSIDSNSPSIADNSLSIDSNCPPNPIRIQSNPNPNPIQSESNPKKGLLSGLLEQCLSQCSDKLRLKVMDWLEYKNQKREPYKPKGFEAFAKKVKSYAAACGEDAVIDAIDDAMANGWKGVVWEKIRCNAEKPEVKSQNKFHNFNQNLNKLSVEEIENISRKNFEKKIKELGIKVPSGE